MKTILLTLLTGFAAVTVTAQTAVDFTANDCAGNNHNLYSELNSGKVIVIAWVMPCAGCVAPSQTAYGIVQTYATSNPGQVLMYVVDDYGNSSCSTLNNWVNNNGMPNAITFSDTSIDMTAYGGVGMPKIIVVGGGYDHGLYFNENNTAADDSAGIQAAIDSALADVTVVPGMSNNFNAVTLFPNPATDHAVLTLNATASENVIIDIYNGLGQIVLPVFNGILSPGEHRIQFSVEGLVQGNYWVRITEGEVTHDEKLSIIR